MEAALHWNGPVVKVRGATTWDHDFCAPLVRGIQNFHMDGRDWADIAYNFIVCPHRYVFEGRGLSATNGANGTNHGNRESPAIMVLAGEGNPFPDDEKIAIIDARDYLVKNTGTRPGLIGHRDHKATACPGEIRYRWVRNGAHVTRPPSQEDEMKFHSHEERVDFVKRCYTKIADRTPAESEVGWWVWIIALNPKHALDLIVDLHAEFTHK